MIFIKVQEEVREGIGLRIDQRNRLYSMDEYVCPSPLREISINKTGERCLILSTCLLNTHIRIGNAIFSMRSWITIVIQVYKDQFIDR